MNIKQEMLRKIDHLPDTATSDDVALVLYEVIRANRSTNSPKKEMRVGKWLNDNELENTAV
jgi:hypothetical protein